MKTLVLGHIHPDTDTTCSAIAYAWYLNNRKNRPAEAVMAGEPNKETAFVLSHFQLPAPRQISSVTAEDSIVIVDTNNPEELLPGHAEAQIVEVIDHHKLAGGLRTTQPPTITMRPVACTATLLLQIMGNDASTLPKEIAGIMAAAIISDTLLFTSPTTTEEDKKAVDVLAKQAGIEPGALADEMFAAKSDLTGLSLDDILTVDSKVIAIGEKRIRISVLETTAPAQAVVMRADLEKRMRERKVEENLDSAFFFVVDILKSEAILIVPSETEKQMAGQAFEQPFTGETLVLPGVISRKKQILPRLEPVISGFSELKSTVASNK
ncbi:manganese-dependent inorganic pyrophosphatase [Patescibacteria group bacterium]|nr:manganese-dependent inorganic pyrophosphatase [Patescibacteria group bacterium]